MALRTHSWTSRIHEFVTSGHRLEHGLLPAIQQLDTIRVQMPEVSRFFGIAIRFYYNDHEPAHFHAVYGEHEALIEIDSLVLRRGELPRRALALVLEWAALHRVELRMNWENARRGVPPAAIAPLD